MLYVKVPKEIREYEERVFIGLTIRQLIWGSAALVAGILWFLITDLPSVCLRMLRSSDASGSLFRFFAAAGAVIRGCRSINMRRSGSGIISAAISFIMMMSSVFMKGAAKMRRKKSVEKKEDTIKESTKRSKKLTKREVRIKRTTQNSIKYRAMQEDGTCVLPNDLYSRS